MKRYRFLDTLRGFALINMIAYHTLWDLVYLFDINLPLFHSPTSHIWQQTICCTFIFLSGFCQPFGRKNLFRGLKVLICSAVITCVTLIFMPDSPVVFGVLMLLGSAMIIFSALEPLLKRINPVLGTTLFLLLFIFTKNVDSGYIGLGRFSVQLPDSFYANTFSAFLGFPHRGFVSSDYFPLFPWLFLFAAGYYLNFIFKKNNLMRFLQNTGISLFEVPGKHSLIIYMLHQPVIYAVLYLIFKGL